ncbi:MAG: c-type cytochrome [Acidobacteria bacterium]|nr:c-type cytochrome [Acidobacteriota bacterium]
MAENEVSEQLEKKVADAPPPDPIAERSFSLPLVISALLLVVVMVWSMYDEVIGQRPWKAYQKDFVAKYTSYLEKVQAKQGKSERELKASAEYQELEQKYQDEEAKAKPRVAEINARIQKIDVQLADITPQFQDTRAWIAAKTFNLENTPEASRPSLRNAIANKKQEQNNVKIHRDAGQTETKSMNFTELERMYNSLRDEKALLSSEVVEITKPQTEAKKKLDAYTQDNLTGLTTQQIGQLIDKTSKFEFKIKQIHVAEGNLVDRCESCHLGIREPLTITKANMKGEAAFVSHPDKELMTIHDPERFGCSTCHGGNGRATVSVEKGHGRYEHWLWPMYYKENVQAGCNQCHNRDRVTQGATVLNEGKNLFNIRGCTGCHRYEGYDRETDTLSSSRQQVKQLEMEKKEYQLAVEDLKQDRGEDRARRLVPNGANLEINQLLAYVSQTVSTIDARIDELDRQAKYLMQDQKKVGPNLKEIKAKLRKEWIPGWLKDPQAFRPGTKMPSFRLEDDEIEAISAFIWQDALDVRVQTQAQGDAEHGKQLFKTLGCLACHSIKGEAIGMGEGVIGGHFAANLSRLGEKANYDYIVRWVYNPRRRLVPYSPSLKRDITAEDYKKKGLPFNFDEEHSKSPVDGREMQIHNMTVMPNFRLSDSDARDVATFLIAQKKQEPKYPSATFMDDKGLAEKGAKLVKTYGCAGCHEIRGLEDEQRIGTELTPEGSKPIERLDFALLTEPAKKGEDPVTGEEMDSANGRENWYDHKGFFENKLKNPGIYDKGKEKPPEERLKMPNIYLEAQDITALTTFLLGSVESSLPASMRYNPTGQKKNVQDGWWVIQKYNCMGCHNVLVGQDSTLMSVAMYQDADGKEQLPPRLTSEGARVDPTWLMRFLKDPSLSSTNSPADNKDPSVIKAALPGVIAHLTGQASTAAMAAKPAAGTKSATPAPSMMAAKPPTPTSPMMATAAALDPSSLLGTQMGANRNGVRSYLKTRMPTFNFSPNELQALVNFFMGASAQQMPYIPERLDPLTNDEQVIARSIFTSQAAPCLKCHMTGDPAHDAKATAPNFLLARERLKPAWTQRWVVGPELISPGTSMPSGLFERDKEHERWIIKGVNSPNIQVYDKDHANLLVRYMFQITPDEQKRLMASGSSGAAATPAPAAGGAKPGGATKTSAANSSRKGGRLSAMSGGR